MADVYIAGSLRHSPKEWWKIYERIADVVKKSGLEAHIPHIHTAKEVNFSTEDIQNPNLNPSIRAKAYKKNLEAIKESKLLIAEITMPSIGTGVEIGFALTLGKQIICLAKKEVDITSMVLGPAHLGLIKVIRYDDIDDALIELENILKNMEL